MTEAVRSTFRILNYQDIVVHNRVIEGHQPRLFPFTILVTNVGTVTERSEGTLLFGP